MAVIPTGTVYPLPIAATHYAGRPPSEWLEEAADLTIDFIQRTATTNKDLPAPPTFAFKGFTPPPNLGAHADDFRDRKKTMAFIAAMQAFVDKPAPTALEVRNAAQQIAQALIVLAKERAFDE